LRITAEMPEGCDHISSKREKAEHAELIALQACLADQNQASSLETVKAQVNLDKCARHDN
jgi:hypothetical protein